MKPPHHFENLCACNVKKDEKNIEFWIFIIWSLSCAFL